MGEDVMLVILSADCIFDAHVAGMDRGKCGTVRMLWWIERVSNVALAERVDIFRPGEHWHAVGEEPQDARDDCGRRNRAQSKAKHLQIHARWLAKKG
jgi:hypothetical protein